VEAVVLGIATDLASTLLVAGGRRLGAEALGDEQEQALQNHVRRGDETAL
jgi:hypothetical protein